MHLERTRRELAYLLSCMDDRLMRSFRLSVGLARVEKVYLFRRLPNDVVDLLGKLA